MMAVDNAMVSVLRIAISCSTRPYVSFAVTVKQTMPVRAFRADEAQCSAGKSTRFAGNRGSENDLLADSRGLAAAFEGGGHGSPVLLGNLEPLHLNHAARRA